MAVSDEAFYVKSLIMLRLVTKPWFVSRAIACCTLLAATTAQASIVVNNMTAKYVSRTAGAYGKVWLDGSASNTNLAGMVQWTTQTPNAPDLVNGVDALGNPIVGSPATNFISFCIEITQQIGPGNKMFDLITLNDAPFPGSGASPMGTTGANAMAKLWKNFLDDALQGSNLAVSIGAFQLSLWEITYDEGSINLTSGRLIASNTGSSTAVYNLANSWLSQLGGLPSVSAADYLYAMTNHKYWPEDVEENFQDQVVGTIPPGGGQVPEAASVVIWGLLGSGIAVVGARRRVF